MSLPTISELFDAMLEHPFQFDGKWPDSVNRDGDYIVVTDGDGYLEEFDTISSYNPTTNVYEVYDSKYPDSYCCVVFHQPFNPF